MRIKICGITKADQACKIASLGADALGFICVPSSPRYVTPRQIAAIVHQILPVSSSKSAVCDPIGVFVNASLDEICQVVFTADLSGVQLHGDESVEFCEALRQRLPAIEIIKAFRVKNPETLEQAMAYSTHVDTLLLDAYHPDLAGGTGHVIDWQWLTTFQPTCPWLLAGGLTPDNVSTALQDLRPQGIDLSSGVENKPGDKNLEAVARLFQQVRHLTSTMP